MFLCGARMAAIKYAEKALGNTSRREASPRFGDSRRLLRLEKILRRRARWFLGIGGRRGLAEQ